jgi:hypothetical protein
MGKVDKPSRQARAALKLAAKQLELAWDEAREAAIKPAKGELSDQAGAAKSARRRSLSLSLSQIPSEFEKLCDELGGPADIGVKFNKRDMNRYCKDYPSRRIVPILRQYTSDESSARRLWPWAAFAIGQYNFEFKERAKYSDEPTPDEVAEMLLEIESSARNLRAGLSRLQTLSYRVKDPTALLRRPHLAWLYAIVSQAAAGVPSDDVNEEPLHQLVVDSAKQAFVERLAMVEGAANFAGKRLDRTLLDRERDQSNPALRNFIFRCSQIWTSLTSRRPSANKVHRRDGSEDPDFVLFLQGLARVAGAPEPTRYQVTTCLRNLTPAITPKNSL